MREEEESAARPARLHRTLRGEAETETARGLAGPSEGDRVSTKPKTWDGKKRRPAKKAPKALAQPAEKIPDEVEVLDEQTRLGTEPAE